MPGELYSRLSLSDLDLPAILFSLIVIGALENVLRENTTRQARGEKGKGDIFNSNAHDAV